MKLNDIIKILAQELGTSDVNEVNKKLKAKDAPKTRYKLTGKKIGHLGFTGLIKAIAADGVKVFDVNKVTLFRFEDIEKFEKAKPKVERAVKPKEAKVIEKPAKKASKKSESTHKDLDDDGDDEDLRPIKFRKKVAKAGATGSRFIPKAKK